MSWQPYRIDDCARQVVLKALERDQTRDSLNQVFKMRITCAYGLERFWGEYLRLKQNRADQLRAEIVLDTWRFLSKDILVGTGIDLPYEPQLDPRDRNHQEAVRSSLIRIWDLRTRKPYQAQVALSVLTTFCEAIIWWKNRLAVKR
jgi:hypothetical protein